MQNESNPHEKNSSLSDKVALCLAKQDKQIVSQQKKSKL
jgi:hypothetical protein